MLLQLFGNVRLDESHVRLAVVVGAHIIKCRKQFHLHATLQQVVSHHVGAHQLALCQNFLLQREGIFLCGEVVQVAEYAVEQCLGLVCVFGLHVEVVHVLHIEVAQFVDDIVSSFWIALVDVVGNFYQRVGRARHGGEDHNLLFAVVYEFAHIFHALGRAYGGAAEFQYFHVRYIFV